MLSTSTVTDTCTAGLDQATPGGVYLCQVGPAVSCGACCGLYNVNNLSRDSLTQKLSRRTKQFAQVGRAIEAIDRFGEEALKADGKNPPIKDFHHCPFLGLTGPQKSTVGCLLHPLADGNNGIDWRGLSYYGAFACATYFCPTCHELEPRYKRVVRQAVDNWYDYGLMITETAMLKTFFGQVEQRLGRTVDAGDMARQPAAAAVRCFLAVKTAWLFADSQNYRPANFFFNKKEHAPPAIDFTALGAEESKWAPVLTGLWSALPGPAALLSAEVCLDRMADDLAFALKA